MTKKQVCDKCGHDRLWAMRRAVRPHRMVDGKLALEIYGKQCDACLHKMLFENPVPETEIAWKDAGDGRRVVA